MPAAGGGGVRRARGFARVPEALGSHMGEEGLLDLFAEGEAVVSNTAFSGLELAYEDAREATFETVSFRGCVFDGVDFTGCTLRDVRFSGCRFVRCAMDRTWLDHVDFRDCSAPGLSLMKARLASVALLESDLSYANLSETSIDRLRVCGSRLVEAALQRSRVKHAAFDGSDLTRLDVFGTPLAGIDVSTCTFAAPVVSGNFHELRGLTVSPEQAIALADLLGVTVAE